MRAVFKIFEKALKIENCSKFIMVVMLRKSLVLEIKRAQTNKTFMVSTHKFNAYLGVTWSNFIKILFFFQSRHLISLNKKHGLKWFFDLFEIKHTDFLYSCIFPLPYIAISEIGISFFITDLVQTKFMLYPFIFLVYRFHGSIDYL